MAASVGKVLPRHTFGSEKAIILKKQSCTRYKRDTIDNTDLLKSYEDENPTG